MKFFYRIKNSTKVYMKNYKSKGKASGKEKKITVNIKPKILLYWNFKTGPGTIASECF